LMRTGVGEDDTCDYMAVNGEAIGKTF
jgi:hypothetical protein